MCIRDRVQVFEERVDLSNDMTGWQMIAVGIRRLVLARGELDRLEGPGYAARRTELRRKAKEAARTRDRQAAASQDEAEENDATEGEVTRERTTRVGQPRGGMKVAARSGERLRREIGRGRLPRVGDGLGSCWSLKISLSLRLNKQAFPLAPRPSLFLSFFLYSTLSFPLCFPGETIKFSGL